MPSYDQPFRVTYTFSGNANAAVDGLIPVPKFAMRFRVAHVAHAAPTFADADTADLGVEIGVTGAADKFHASTLTVDTANPTNSFSGVDDSFEADEQAELVFSRPAVGAITKPVVTTVVVDWY